MVTGRSTGGLAGAIYVRCVEIFAPDGAEPGWGPRYLRKKRFVRAEARRRGGAERHGISPARGGGVRRALRLRPAPSTSCAGPPPRAGEVF